MDNIQIEVKDNKAVLKQLEEKSNGVQICLTYSKNYYNIEKIS